MKNNFYCISCQTNKPMEQLGRIIKKSHSKRCKTCCARADAQRAVLAAGQANKSRREFSAFADEMRRLEQRGLPAD